MCYGSGCYCEDYMGECNLFTSERNYLEDKYGHYCMIPYCEEDLTLAEDYYKKMYEDLQEYRISRKVMEKLIGEKYF